MDRDCRPSLAIFYINIHLRSVIFKYDLVIGTRGRGRTRGGGRSQAKAVESSGAGHGHTLPHMRTLSSLFLLLSQK